MTLTIDNLTVEGLTSTNRIRVAADVQATTSGTYTFSITSPGAVIFTGSSAGQSVSLGDATSYQIGQEFWVYNDSTQSVLVKNAAGASLIVLQLEMRVKAVLQSNATSAGVWTLTTYIKQTATVGSTAVAFFADSTNSVSNRFLSTQNLNSSDIQPAVMPAGSIIRTVTYVGSQPAPIGTIEFRVNTTTGTPALSCILTTTTNTQVFTGLSLAVNAGDYINCKIGANASGVGKPMVICYF